MEMVLSAAFGEVITRSINFFINKTSNLQVLDMENRLCRVLLRAQVIVDEAMGRYITNQAMLQQLNMLRDAIHRGCYTLDSFKYQSHDMFGRQMETEHVINFLLHAKPHCDKKLEVLPIVGLGRVGMSTLVAHVCNDERIRDHFSE
ncbi:hypothetical protein BAE44_0003581, partial [Dichanthelium oligosanthes]